MEDLLLRHGLPALFCLSFLAATLLPLGSEWLLAALVLQGQPIASLVGIATLGNTLGAATTYAAGLWGSALVVDRLLRLDPRRVGQAMRLYGRYGSWTLLLSWLPIIGDPLCLAAGILKLDLPRFVVLVGLGKLLRYLVVALLVS